MARFRTGPLFIFTSIGSGNARRLETAARDNICRAAERRSGISIMDEFDSFDPELFGLWTERPVYGDGIAMEDERLAEKVRGVLLETKSAEGAVSPSDELRRLLNEMTVEMRAQFGTFRDMRRSAEKALEDGDEAAQKLARADVKAATDAMSLIVRTLEKVDSLQRQISRDREIEAERAADEGGYEEAKQRFIKMIEDRANETAVRLFEAWKCDGPPPRVSGLLERKATEPPDDTPGGREDGEQAVGGFEASQPHDEDDHGHT